MLNMRKCITIIMLTLGLIFCISMPASAVSFNMGGDESSESDTESIISDTGENNENCSVSTLSTANVVDSGTCGDNLTWTVYDDGLLEIDGTGSMTSYWYDSDYKSTAPWIKYSEQINRLQLNDGITKIGSYAFHGMSSIEGSLVIPDSVVTIDYDAFSSCSGFTGELIIPDSIEYIEYQAFNICSGFTGELVLPSTLKSIGVRAFGSCEGLSGLTISDGVEVIKADAFAWCTGLTGNLIIPDSVTSIGNEAFNSCTGITEINVDDNNSNYKDLDGVLFTKNGDTLIQFPAGKTKNDYVIPNSVTTISAHAFSKCSGLTGDLIIPDSVTTIGNYAFYGCSSLGSVTIGTGVITISSNTYFNCSSLTDIYINQLEGSISGSPWSAPNAKVYWDVKDHGYCGAEGNEENVQWILHNDGLLEIVGTGAMGDYDYVNVSYGTFDRPWDNYKNQIKNIVVQDGITKIGKNAFNYCENIMNIKLPDSLITIDNWSFYRCKSISTIELPDTITYLGERAFCYCTNLSSINIPLGVSKITFGQFEWCPNLKEIYIHKNVKEIARMAFKNCGELNIVVDPENEYFKSVNGVLYNKDMTKLIAYTVDKNEPNFEIPYGVVDVSSAFNNCSYLGNVKIPETVVNLGYACFMNCSSLKSVHIPNNVISYLDYQTFQGCNRLEHIEIDHAENIFGKAQFGAPSTTEVTFLRELKAEGLQDQTYTGSAIKPITLYEVRKDDASIKDPLQSSLYTITYTNNKNVGTASVKATLKRNSSVILDDTFEILPKNCSSLNISSIPNKTYTGSEVKPKPTVTDPDI